MTKALCVFLTTFAFVITLGTYAQAHDDDGQFLTCGPLRYFNLNTVVNIDKTTKDEYIVTFLNGEDIKIRSESNCKLIGYSDLPIVSK